MSLAIKARENLDAGETLLLRGSLNSATSRFYYALFQSGVVALEKAGKTPAKIKANASKWEHGMVSSNASLVRHDKGDRRTFEAMRSLREEADYHATHIEREKLEGRLTAVRELIEAGLK